MKKIILGITLLFLVGCSSAEKEPVLSTMQARHISTKEFAGNYKQVMRATSVVLQDQGYIIQNSDHVTGLIFAEKEVSKDSKAQEYAEDVMLSIIFKNHKGKYTKAAKVKLSATVDVVNLQTTEVRLNAQQMDIKGGENGDSMGPVVTIHNPEVYKALFDQISIELERIKAKK